MLREITGRVGALALVDGQVSAVVFEDQSGRTITVHGDLDLRSGDHVRIVFGRLADEEARHSDEDAHGDARMVHPQPLRPEAPSRMCGSER